MASENDNNLRQRLLFAAACGYIKSQVHIEPTPSNISEYAQWLTHTHDPVVFKDIKVEVQLNDLLDAIQKIENSNKYKQMYFNERESLNSWIRGWAKVRDSFFHAADWKKGTFAAVRALGFNRLKKGELNEKEQYALVSRYRELSEGLFDYSSNIQHPKLSKIDAICRIAEERNKEPEAIIKALHRAGVRGLPRL